jgi:hypothetical protein
MTLSGPKACLGSTKEARILPAFLHSPGRFGQSCCPHTIAGNLRNTSAGDSLLIDEGSGLLIPKGILAAGDNPSNPLDEKRRDCCAVREVGEEVVEVKIIIRIEKLTLRAAVEWVELQPDY